MKKSRKEVLPMWSLKKPYLIDKKDKRYKKFSKQLKTRGFCSSEVWCLDAVICQFILPRLKAFREHHAGYPSGSSKKEWNAILDEMIFALEWHLGNHLNFEDNYERDCKRYENGMQLFINWFGALWS